MGIGMAKNLQRHLRQTGASALCYTNRTLSRGAPLQELGGMPCQTIPEVVEKADIIFLSVIQNEKDKQNIADDGNIAER